MTKLKGEVDREIVERDFPGEYAELKRGVEGAGDDIESARWQVNRDFYKEGDWSSTSITVTSVMFVDHRIHKREIKS